MIGTTLSHYRVLEKLGAGGMGEVYRAEDTTLGRHVAIKVLPDAFRADVERLTRFEREAKALASLNHPNIAAIYGLEEGGGRRLLVMELVEGETLAQRISRAPLPVEEALEVSRQIAEGLEAAHEKGVIHRDLKPSNVKLTSEGKVKILDFGLAKALQEPTTTAAREESPTITDTMTRPGVLLGTAAYMAPEQAKGKGVDKRVDVWAFGCVLYECLTGVRAFRGESITEVLVRILESEPDWSLLPNDLPANVRAVLEWCLRKDASKRLRDLGDAKLEFEEPRSGSTVPVAGRTAGWRLFVPWALTGVLGVMLVLAMRRLWDSGTADVRPVR
jgi:serine/threonine protein kinase